MSQKQKKVYVVEAPQAKEFLKVINGDQFSFGAELINPVTNLDSSEVCIVFPSVELADVEQYLPLYNNVSAGWTTVFNADEKKRNQVGWFA